MSTGPRGRSRGAGGDAPAGERAALLRRLDALRQQLAERPRSERR